MLLRRIGFIGFKRMGEAIAEGMRGGNFKLEHFLVCSPSLMNGSRSTPFPVAENNPAVAAWADFLVLATKPAQIKDVCEEIAPEIQARKQKPVLVSVAAGKLIKTMEAGLGCDDVPIVRAMTSTPSLVQKGMTVWYANSLVTPGQLLTVREAFASVGSEMQVDSEDKLDMATAVSSSGPAYFFYMQECMIQSAMKLGFSREEAVVLVNQTALGSAELAMQSDLSPTELRENVTSPDGTTEEGLAALMDGRVAAAVDDCVQEAYQRSIAMGQGVLISPRKKLEGVPNRHVWFPGISNEKPVDAVREALLAESTMRAPGC